MRFFKRARVPVVSAQEGYRRWAASYREETNPIKENSDRLIEKWFPEVTGKVVLDAGCGAGTFCELAETRGAVSVTGVDLSPEMLEIAKTYCKRTEFLCLDLNVDAVPQNKYDLVICGLVLGHCENLQVVLENLRNSLTPRGQLIITDFHPHQSLQNAKRTFRDCSNGQTIEIRHFTHLLSDYFSGLSRLGFSLEEVEEPSWMGTPVIFGIKARIMLRS